ncbi:unnamed protein product [Rotaria sordida]|uniref:VWFA domain-containing protein n=1 Tax=Rotaria sordida TaxID=392033 RepID=A0A818RF73_9BILA|nr:unnamed protein product [Rotaria sordida]
MPASEVNGLDQYSDRSLQRRISGALIRNFIEDAIICEISRQYEVRPEMAIYLQELRKYEIVIVCDDSGSMETEVDGTERTRWNELCEIVKIVLDIGVKFDSNGVDIYFLNREKRLRVKDPTTVEHAFKTPPIGYTPMVPVLKNIFQSELARRGRDKKLLVFVATDGLSTDEEGNDNVPELERLMQEERQANTTYVSFLLCTDDPDCVRCLKRWDGTMVNVDVTDDFETQKKQVHECSGADYPFSHGDYIVKALVGAIVRAVDIIDEPH